MRSLDFSRYVLSSCVAAALLAGCGGSPPVGAPHVSSAGEALPYHHTFSYTGAEQSFKVPPGVTSISVVARGAAGGAIGSYYGSDGGTGGRVHAVIPVYPGEKLYVFVGGVGFVKSYIGYGGFNGGGDAGPDWSGFGGGGASDIRQGGARLSDRILVAGGGGGDGGNNSGGAGGTGGGLVGGPGGNAQGEGGSGGGGGGSQNSGGAGGAGGFGSSSSGYSGSAGTLGDGGMGGNGRIYTSSDLGGSGGGGGGGYYGGGGGGGGSPGAQGAGGGGGSSYVESSATNVHFWRGWKNATGDGLIVFSW